LSPDTAKVLKDVLEDLQEVLIVLQHPLLKVSQLLDILGDLGLLLLLCQITNNVTAQE